MKLRKQFSNLKKGAKKVFIGMLVLCLISTATGIGSIFAYAVDHEGEHEYGEWVKFDDEYHIRYCTIEGCDSSETDRHNFSDWGSADNGKEKRVCICGAEEYKDVECQHTNTTYEITETTHKLVCADCGEELGSPEDHSYETSTNDAGEIVHTCTVCENSYTEQVEPKLTPDTLDFDVTAIDPDAGQFLLNSLQSVSPSDMDKSGNYSYIDFFTDNPPVIENLTYNGQDQNLVQNSGELVCPSDVISVDREGLVILGGDAPVRKEAGTYTVIDLIIYKIQDYQQAFSVTGVYEVSIEPVSLGSSDITFSSDTDSYVEITNSDYPGLKFGDTDLVEGTDYTVSGDSFGSSPGIGDVRTYTFTGKGNFKDSITKTIEVKDVGLTYNERPELFEKYHRDLTIKAPTGYGIARDTTSTFADSVVFTKSNQGSDPSHDLYLHHNGKIIKKTVNFTIADDDDYMLDDFISTDPAFYTTRTYTGSLVDLMLSPPVLDEIFISDADIRTIDWGFTDLSNNIVSTNQSPKATLTGSYTYKLYVKFITAGGTSKTIYGTSTYTSMIVKNIGDSYIQYTASPHTDYQSLVSSNIKSYYSVRDTMAATASQQQLQENVDYTVTIDPEINPQVACYDTGTNITLIYTGITDENVEAYYTGTTTKTIPVSKVDILLNGKPQVSKYDDEVVITANGYTISDTFSGSYNSEYRMSVPCQDYTLTLYFMKDGTSKIVKQDITGLNISDAAAITLLYDGKAELKPRYYDSVRISADGYKVSASIDGTFEENYKLEYSDLKSANKETAPVEDFHLYFQNKTTGVKTIKKVSGINLLEMPDIEIIYDGATLKDWYTDNVTVTAPGYKIALDKGTQTTINDFSSKYIMKGTGSVSEKLSFIENSATDLDHKKTYTLVVNIDRTAPTGVINLGSYSSNEFTSKEFVKAYVNGGQKASISASDDLSGIDYIHYYLSENFYSSASDVTAAMSEKSAAWRNYSETSQPTIPNKSQSNYIYAELVDKAGNKTYISLGNIMCDTVAPKMTTATVAPSADGKKTAIALAGTDKQSGINRFKMMYREKSEGKNTPPDKEYLFDQGEYIKTAKEQDGTAVASYEMDSLDPEKTYMFYFVAVDRAGNISEVMEQEVKGSEAASKEAQNAAGGSGASGGSGGGSPSGLTPAPNGIAGGGSSKPKQNTTPSSSNTKKAQSPLGDKDREINRNPYIADATGNVKIGINETSGWGKIASEVNKADKGAVIEVEMAGLSNVSGELLKSMNNRDVEVKLRMSEGVEWGIKGEEVPNARSDIDMGVRLGSRNIPEQILADVTGTYPHVEFSINHEGDFGFVATIAVPVGESNKGMFTTLYHYDEAKKDLEVAGNGKVDDKGYAKFPLTHASDYTVVISPERILTAAEADATTATLVGTQESEAQYLDGARLRLTDIFRVRGSMRVWLFVVALLSATACLIILYLPAMQLRNQNDQGDLF